MTVLLTDEGPLLALSGLVEEESQTIALNLLCLFAQDSEASACVCVFVHVC